MKSRIMQKRNIIPRRAPLKGKNVRKKVKDIPQKKKEPSLSDKDWSIIRIIGVGVFFTLIWCALWSRAFYLQIITGPDLAEKAYRQYMTREMVAGVRGTITDRNGNILAQSVDVRSITADPSIIHNKDRVALALSKILKIPPDKIKKSLDSNKRFSWIARKVDPAAAEKVRTAKLAGIQIASESDRVYPYKELAGQLLGFVDVDDNGLDGLEKSLDEELRGIRVRQVVYRDAVGRRFAADKSGGLDDLRGHDVRLTIDANVQFFAEEALAENVEKFAAKWGGCIVVDVPTGDILAWAQYPFFNPNNHQAYAQTVKRNRLASDALEQGSTIKSFLIAAALEEGVVDTDTIINCEKGVWKIGKNYIHDDHPFDLLPVKKVLHVSSNIGAAKIGNLLTAEKYYDYLTRLGFGSKVSLPIVGQSRGILRSYRHWQDIDLATASFGQSFSATMLQMAQAYLVLASDGEKKPLRLTLPVLSDDLSITYLKKKNEVNLDNQVDKIFSKATIVKIRDMLRNVVEEGGGTGKQARIPGMVVGGKTGTAQKASGGTYGRGRVGSFVGMIPIDNPRYLICVLLDEPAKVQYGGINSAPVFRQVALRTMAYHGLLPSSDDPLVKQIVAKNPLFKKPEELPEITMNTVAPKLPVFREKRSTKYVAGKVPSVIGMGMRKAIEAFAKHGVVPAIIGKGAFVIKQEPMPGVAWPKERACTLWLEESAS